MLKPDYPLIVEANYRVSKYRQEVEHQQLAREALKPLSSRGHNFVYRLIALIRRYPQAMTTGIKHRIGSGLKAFRPSGMQNYSSGDQTSLP